MRVEPLEYELNDGLGVFSNFMELQTVTHHLDLEI
jgi:hypothetical protein